MRAIATAGIGFLLAVLWFDLMFDVQLRGGAQRDAVESIRRYYRRVTTEARPMNRLVALVMAATLGALVAEVVAGDDVSLGAAIASLVLVATAVSIAATRTVPRAVRLGTDAGSAAGQAAAARAILREHVACLTLVAIALAVQLAG